MLKNYRNEFADFKREVRSLLDAITANDENGFLNLQYIACEVERVEAIARTLTPLHMTVNEIHPNKEKETKQC